ncbi:MAG: hypothetical protein A2Z78_00710 [Candidatus Nealsonbacteria bacterium RBG_13_36_15]|uniref:Uncharacterized protein n=1 Tax=Candidatus Nealsonbacteria bacterium RBG_13_36_15 TaxID=1801660 RepID=A0A1G2DUK3_9BACT|nr:MAG: hypothetical protein A2Z78_00710 [Candidatus Nealsonbacteria bacterium RBG_13_36_15]
MDKKLMIFIIVALIIVAVVCIFAYSLVLKEKPSVITPAVEGIKEITPPPATGNVDDLTDALIKEVADTEPILTEEDSDAAIINNDSQEISDFGQSVNENEF